MSDVRPLVLCFSINSKYFSGLVKTEQQNLLSLMLVSTTPDHQGESGPILWAYGYIQYFHSSDLGFIYSHNHFIPHPQATCVVGTLLKPGNLNLNLSFPRYLEVVFCVDGKPVTEHVPHDDEVRVLVVDSNTVHTEELRKQRDAVTLYNVLETHTFMSIKYL